MKFLVVVLTLFVLFAPVSAQEKGIWTSSGWREFSLDRTSTEDALKIVGKPDRDRIGSLPDRIISTWLSPKQKEKVFRTLVWFDKQETVDITFSFLDNKLVFINVVFKMEDDNGRLIQRSPDLLGSIFGEKFVSVADGGKRLMPLNKFRTFEGESSEKLVKKAYSLIAISTNSFILASIWDVPEEEMERGIFGGVGRNIMAKSRNAKRRDYNAKQKFPGQVRVFLLVSRVLEAKY